MVGPENPEISDIPGFPGPHVALLIFRRVVRGHGNPEISGFPGPHVAVLIFALKTVSRAPFAIS